MIGREWIQRRIKAIENKETVPNDVLTRTLKLASKDQLADLEHLVDHFANFHTGGAEPVATALSFTLVLIHLNPEEGLKPLMSEIDEVLGKKKTITVVLEAMRMYFPATPIPKESPSEGISLDGHFIPPGIPIATHGGAMGRMPQYFEEPDTFKPSRFAPDKKRPSPFVFFPYGLGDRSCVGIRVAKVSSTAIKAHTQLSTFGVIVFMLSSLPQRLLILLSHSLPEIRGDVTVAAGLPIIQFAARTSAGHVCYLSVPYLNLSTYVGSLTRHISTPVVMDDHIPPCMLTFQIMVIQGVQRMSWAVRTCGALGSCDTNAKPPL
eukprot:Em0013g666a